MTAFFALGLANIFHDSGNVDGGIVQCPLFLAVAPGVVLSQISSN